MDLQKAVKDFFDPQKRRDRALSRAAAKAQDKSAKIARQAEPRPTKPRGVKNPVPGRSKKWLVPDSPDFFRVYGVKADVKAAKIKKIIYYAACDKVEDDALAGSEVAKPSNDFYYCYYYDKKKKVLKYLALQSKKDLTGKRPNLAYALVNPGKYYLEFDKGPFLLVDSTEDDLSLKAVQSIPEDEYINLHEALKHSDKIPASCSFNWMKQREALSLNLISLSLLVLAMLFSYAKTTTLEDLKVRVRENKDITAHLTGDIRGLPNLAKIIQKVADELRNDDIEAATTKIELKNDMLVFYIYFADSTEAQIFSDKIGGKIEGDQVIYSAPAI